MRDLMSFAANCLISGVALYFGAYVVATVIFVLYCFFEKLVCKEKAAPILPEANAALLFYLTILVSVVIYWFDKNEKESFLWGSWMFAAAVLIGIGIKIIVWRIKGYPYTMEPQTKAMVISMLIVPIALLIIKLCCN